MSGKIRSAVFLLASTAAFLACAKSPPPTEPRQEARVVGSPPMACTGTPTNITPLWQLATDARGEATCPLGSTVFGSAAAGEPCSHPKQCAPSCCACSDGKSAVMTSLCLNGHCSPAMDACCALAGTKTHSCGQLP